MSHVVSAVFALEMRETDLAPLSARQRCVCLLLMKIVIVNSVERKREKGNKIQERKYRNGLNSCDCFCIKQQLFNIKDMSGLVSNDAMLHNPSFSAVHPPHRWSHSYSPFDRRHGFEPF